MLYWLFETLTRDSRSFNVFRYITLRAVLGVLTALAITFIRGSGRHDPQAHVLQIRPGSAR